MKLLKYVLLLNIGFAFFSVDGSEIESVFNLKDSSSSFRRIIPFVYIAGKQNDVPYAPSTEMNTLYGIGISAEIYANFSLGLAYQGGPDDSKKSETNRDQDIQDAAGKSIRLVNRDISYQFDEDKTLAYSLEYRIHMGEKMMIVPFLGYSSAKGRISAERFDMTDRDKPILFSKHNRYTLTSENHYKKTSFSIGNRVFFRNNFFFEGRFLHSRLNFEETLRNINTQGETIAFSEQDFYFENVPSKSRHTDNVMQIAFGLFF